MLTFDDGGSAFAQLTAAQRLAWVDFLTAAIGELTQQMDGKYDGSILSSLFDINRMLEIMREDLQSSMTRAIEQSSPGSGLDLRSWEWR